MKKKELEVKSYLSFDEAMEYVEGVLHSLKQGTAVVEMENEQITLTPGNKTVQLEIDAEDKRDSQKFVIKLKWRKDEGDLEDFSGEEEQ